RGRTTRSPPATTATCRRTFRRSTWRRRSTDTTTRPGSPSNPRSLTSPARSSCSRNRSASRRRAARSCRTTASAATATSSTTSSGAALSATTPSAACIATVAPGTARGERMDNEPPRRALRLYVIVAVVAAAVTAGIAALLVNIFQRKQEARSTYVKLVEVTEDDVDPAKWGTNWPREYDGYLRTAEPTATKYGGGLVGPEGTLPPQKAERDPWLTRIFAGYLFAVDYRDRRGHAYIPADQEVTKRNLPSEAKQSGNCLHCHASIMPLYRKLGRQALPQGSEAQQIQKGLELVSEMDYWDAHKALEQG